MVVMVAAAAACWVARAAAGVRGRGRVRVRVRVRVRGLPRGVPVGLGGGSERRRGPPGQGFTSGSTRGPGRRLGKAERSPGSGVYLGEYPWAWEEARKGGEVPR